MTKSICLATYNGSEYIEKQLNSIIGQLGENDELIIIDDCSKDNTVDIIESYNDRRIILHKNKSNLRHVKTFEKAIGLAKNELVFLSDQDDIWLDNRLKIFENYFNKNPKVELITSNFFCIDENDILIENLLRKVGSTESFSYNKNIISILTGSIGYYGCAMAFRKNLIKTILPIPDYIEAHDLWIAMAANMRKTNLHIDEKTLYHRIHQNNASNLNRKTIKKIQSRVDIFKALIELKRR